MVRLLFGLAALAAAGVTVSRIGHALDDSRVLPLLSDLDRNEFPGSSVTANLVALGHLGLLSFRPCELAAVRVSNEAVTS